MTPTKILDEEISHHLKQINNQQKQIVLIVLKTMSAQNKKPDNGAKTIINQPDKVKI